MLSRKKKLIIESNSVSKSSSEKRKKQTNKTKKKKLIIVNSLSSSSPKLKEKIDKVIPGKLGEQQKDLKKSQDMKLKMSHTEPTIELPSGRLNEKFIELMEKLADIMLKQG